MARPAGGRSVGGAVWPRGIVRPLPARITPRRGAPPLSTAHLIPALEPKLRALYDQHKERAAAIDWAYTEYLPLDELRADPQSLPRLSAATYLAVETALLTEVNLPWFTAGLDRVYRGALSPMREFIHEWTSEEDQHALLLETYLLLGDNGDHRERARIRKLIVRQGWEPKTAQLEDQFQAIAYREGAPAVPHLRGR